MPHSPSTVAGKHAVEFKLGNLTALELNLCDCLKQLLCDPRHDKLRRKLNSGTGMELAITPDRWPASRGERMAVRRRQPLPQLYTDGTD